MDLFAALDYIGPENRATALLLAVLHHLSEPARARLLEGIVPGALGSDPEIRTQHPVPVGVLDGWLRWSGQCVVALEAKVDAAFGTNQPDKYAQWLAARDEPHRVLWVVTRERASFEDVASSCSIPPGVHLVGTTWSDIANRALEIAPDAGEADQLLLNALGRRLHATGVASRPLADLDPTLLGLALGALPQVRRLRRHLVRWFEELSWFPGDWIRKARHDSWVDLSVFAERWLELATPLADGKRASIAWYVEVFAPSGREGRWPAEQRRGACLRVGVHLKGHAVADVALEPLRAALGLPAAARRSDFLPAPLDAHPWAHDAGSYHEVWWMVRFDPTDLPGTAARLRSAMAEQARRLSSLVAGGSDAVRIPPA